MRSRSTFAQSILSNIRLAMVTGVLICMGPVAKASCPSPRFNFCTIIIGSSNEIDLFKTAVGATNNVSADNCIRFVDLVDSGNPSWHSQMLSKTTDPCHAILVSGHHDVANSAGGNRRDILRSRYNYSDTAYQWEKGNVSSPGPRLDLALLARTNPVCGDVGQNCGTNGRLARNGNASCFIGRTSNSGDMLLGNVLTAFLFACNMLRDSAYAAYLPGPSVPGAAPVEGKPGIFKPFSFKDRTEAIYNRATHIFGFEHRAPAGIAVAPAVKTFLANLRKSYRAPGDVTSPGPADFFTRYLLELSVLRQYEDAGGDLSDSTPQYAKLNVKNQAAKDVFGNLITPQFLAACMAKRAPNCSNIEAARSEACEEFQLLDDDNLPDSDARKCTETRLNTMRAKFPERVPRMIVCSAGRKERQANKADYCSHLEYTTNYIKKGLAIPGGSSEAVRRINEHFTAIRKTFNAPGVEKLPEDVVSKIFEAPSATDPKAGSMEERIRLVF